MSTERDPRTDPRPGDIVEANGTINEILWVSDLAVRVKVFTISLTWMKDWIRFAEGGQIIARGAERQCDLPEIEP